jgi:hypothetical protein
MNLKGFWAKNKHRIINWAIVIGWALAVILLFATNNRTRDFFYKKYRDILKWQNDAMRKEIDGLIEDKKKDMSRSLEEIAKIENEVKAIEKSREQNDELVEDMAYRDLSDLLSDLVSR